MKKECAKCVHFHSSLNSKICRECFNKAWSFPNFEPVEEKEKGEEQMENTSPLERLTKDYDGPFAIRPQLRFTCPDCVHAFDPADWDICATCVLESAHPNYKSQKSHSDENIEFHCPDCLYWGISMYESPCSECFMTLTRPKFVPMYKEEKEMVKTCSTCAHLELLVSEEPCASCLRGNGSEDKFEPATEKKEEEEMVKTCATCTYRELSINKEPCASCKAADRFEPKTEPAKDDKVNHPNRYTTGEIEVIKYIQDKLGCEEFTGYCIGNVMKYISRWRHKDGKQDLEKAKVYLQWAIESAERELEGKKNGTGEGN